jgi:hypothetical protein
MAQGVTLMMASRGWSFLGSGTLSQRMSLLSCQVSAFMSVLAREYEQPTRPNRNSLRDVAGG